MSQFVPRNARVVSVASAFPQNEYTQKEIGELLGVTSPVVQKLLAAPHIQTRRLGLDAVPRGGLSDEPHAPMPTERLSDLHARFLRGIRTFGADSARAALQLAGVDASRVAVVVTVTSSGMALPGISAILMKEMGLNRKAHRVDLVGMGCCAGMSGLRTLSNLLAAYAPGSIGLLVCVEVSSALYVRDDTVGTGVVNSLFGDGAVATVVEAAGSSVTASSGCGDASSVGFSLSASASPSRASTPRDNTLIEAFDPSTPSLVSSPLSEAAIPPGLGALSVELSDFEAHTWPELFDDMRYDVPEEHQKYAFRLSKRIPQAVGDAVAEPVNELLQRHGLTSSDVAHWVVHSGGKDVMAAVVRNLGIPDEAIRHTRSVLRDFGNISSASFLVSFERLIEEHRASLKAANRPVLCSGDRVCFIAMGPGTTIEVGLGVIRSM